MSFKVENMEEKNMVKLVIELLLKNLKQALTQLLIRIRTKSAFLVSEKVKAPRKMVEKLYGAEIFYEDAANAIIPDAYAKAAVRVN